MNPSPVKSFLPAAFLLSVLGWFGLVYVLLYTLPATGPRWLFFFFSVMAVTGFSLPVAAFLNCRFPTNPPAGRIVIVREASLVGICFATLAWLQLGRVLTPGLGLLLAGSIVLVEFLIRLRERSRWPLRKP